MRPVFNGVINGVINGLINGIINRRVRDYWHGHWMCWMSMNTNNGLM